MRKILFFDDFLVNRQHNLVRRFYEPTWMPEHLFFDDELHAGGGTTSVVPAPGGWLMYYAAPFGEGDQMRRGMAASRSDDGLAWQPVRLDPCDYPGFPRAVYALPPHIHLDGCAAYYDADDPDSSRRYKMTEARLERSSDDPNKPAESKDSMSYVLSSPDGLHWRADEAHPFHPRHSDGVNSILRNHRTGRWQIHMRRVQGERRVFRVESDDLKTWTQPTLVAHPDPLDAPMTHFFGMPQFRYADMFIGFLWTHHTTYADTRARKPIGVSDTELVYSYDGLVWNRTHRPFMPLLPLGEYGAGSMQGMAIIERENDLLVYAGARLFGLPSPPERLASSTPVRKLLPGSLRKDGFVSLGTVAGVGDMMTDALCLRGPELSLNIRAPFGGVRVEICDLDSQPLPGYTFAECEPIEGDGIDIRPAWKQHRDLSAAIELLRKSAPVPRCARIHIQLEHADLFSINGDFGVSVFSHAPRGLDYL